MNSSTGLLERPAAERLPRPHSPTDTRSRTWSWSRLALPTLLVLTAVAYLWDLSSSGNANSFYAAAVQAGTKSWKAFFFGSIDSSSFITVDKPPASLWVMALSGRIFGFSSWSMLAPQALEGVAAVGLLYASVRRWFGTGAALGAGAMLAITPVAALMFRFNNPDALLVLLLVAAAYCLVRALEKAGTRWIVAAGTMIGFAFLAKMMQAFLVLPAFALVYMVAAPTGLRRRAWQTLAGGAAVVVSAGWWVAAVALWPVASRPMIDGSSDNSILNLITGYNGLGPDLRFDRWRRWRGRRELQRRHRHRPAVQRPDGRPGLVAAARRAAGARRRTVVGPPRAAHRSHPGRAAAVGRLARRLGPRLQPRQRRDPHVLHGRAGAGDRGAGGDRRLAAVDAPRVGGRASARASPASR